MWSVALCLIGAMAALATSLPTGLAPHRSGAGSAGASSIRSAGLSSNRHRATRQVSRLGLFSRLLLGTCYAPRSKFSPAHCACRW